MGATEHCYKVGDVCADCSAMGQTKYLRLFYINMQETILKCESEDCIYPNDVSSDEEEEEFMQIAKTEAKQEITEEIQNSKSHQEIKIIENIVLSCASNEFTPITTKNEIKQPKEENINCDFESFDIDGFLEVANSKGNSGIGQQTKTEVVQMTDGNNAQIANINQQQNSAIFKKESSTETVIPEIHVNFTNLHNTPNIEIKYKQESPKKPTDNEDIPKATIASFFNAINAKAKTNDSKRFENRIRKTQRTKPKVEVKTKSTGRLDDVLKILQHINKK